MAAIQNDRDLLLQAASPRVVPIPIPIDRIDGLPQALKSLRIKSTATTFIGATGATNPATITLTAEKLGGLVGSVVWSVIAGSGTLTPSGDDCAVTGSTVTGYSITIRARVTVGAVNYDAQITLTKLGTLSAQQFVDLTSQVTGQLAMGNVTGYGALALLNTVNLNTQTTGALNGLTQVTNLGNLAYANAIAANQIGAGQLAAGVVYAGNIYANQVNSGDFSGKVFTGGNFTGGVFQTATGGARVQLVSSSAGYITVFGNSGTSRIFNVTDLGVAINGEGGSGAAALAVGSQGHGISIQTTNGAFALRLSQITTLPSPVAGGIAYHATHKFIFSDGAAWYRPDWTAVA